MKANQINFLNYRPIQIFLSCSKSINISLNVDLIYFSSTYVYAYFYTYFSFNNLRNLNQLVYCKSQFTDTSLLYVHYHFINAIACQKYYVNVFLTCLQLLILRSHYFNHQHLVNLFVCYHHIRPIYSPLLLILLHHHHYCRCLLLLILPFVNSGYSCIHKVSA